MFKGDEVNIYSTISDSNPITIIMQQTMKKDERIMATSQTEFYFVNLSKSKLIRVPKDIIGNLKT